MEFNEAFLSVYAIAQVGVVTPLVAFAKDKLPGTFPIQPVIYTFGLSLLAAWGLSKWLMPGLPVDQMIMLASAGHVVAQATRETKQSLGKIITK